MHLQKGKKKKKPVSVLNAENEYPLSHRRPCTAFLKQHNGILTGFNSPGVRKLSQPSSGHGNV